MSDPVSGESLLSVGGRWRAWQGVVVALGAGGMVWLAVMGGDRGARVGVWTWGLVVGWVVLGVLAGGMWWLLRTTPGDAKKLPEGRSRGIILGMTAGLGVAAVVCGGPVLSNDWRRYVADADAWRNGVNPYVVPAERATKYAAEVGVDHAGLTTIYPPVAQAVFNGAYKISDGGGRRFGGWVPGPVTVMRAGFAGCMVVCVWLVLGLLRREGASPWWAAVAGLSPVAYVETGWSPHVDVVGVMLLLGCVAVARARQGFWAGVLLALAAGVKPQVVVVVPFLVREVGWRSLVGFAVAAVGVSVPLWAQGAAAGWMRTMSLYSTAWEANGGIFEVLKSAAGLSGDPRAVNRLKDVGRLLGPCAVVVGGWVMWRRGAGVVGAAYGLQLIMLLASPVVYPWYLLWVVFLAPLLGARGFGGTAVVWGATVGVSYLLGRLGAGWTLPMWAVLLEYVPVWGAAGVEYWRGFESARREVDSGGARAAGH